MEFGWNADQVAYRARLVKILEEELPIDWWGNYANDGPADPRVMNFARKFCKRLASEGLVVPHWPRAYGGQEFDSWAQIIINEEMWAAGEPRSSLYMGANWAGPAVMQYGTEEQKQIHLNAIASGDVLWCQGFSEPNAGSDLASMRTMATPVEGGYVINGSKVWTSYAHSADWCFLLARTHGKGRDGICCFLVPTSVEGLEIRSIPGLSAEHDMHELFFSDVFLPTSALLGEEGKGWSIVTNALAHERVGVARYEFASRALARAVGMLRQRGRFDDPAVRVAAAVAHTQCEASRMLTYRVIDERSRNIPPKGTTNISRMAMIDADHAVVNFIASFLPDALVDGGDGLLQAEFKIAIISGLGAGPLEIQRNLASYLHLGLTG